MAQAAGLLTAGPDLFTGTRVRDARLDLGALGKDFRGDRASRRSGLGPRTKLCAIAALLADMARLARLVHTVGSAAKRVRGWKLGEVPRQLSEDS
jgi:hypothetical protein